MRSLAILLARLYPRKWRARYGGEFEALLEEAAISWPDLIDMAVSIVKMRMGGSFAMEGSAIQPRVLDLKDRDIPHGYDLETVIEFPRSDGSMSIVRSFYREVDLGDTYFRISHSSRDSAIPRTTIVFGRKGLVNDDVRTDETGCWF